MIDLGTMEIFPIFRAMQKGLIDQDTGLVLLESQVIMSGLIAPENSEKLSLEQGLSRNLINLPMYQQLLELQDSLSLISRLTETQGPLSVMEAIERKIISERLGLKVLETHLATGSFSLSPSENCINLEEAFHQGFISSRIYSVLQSHLKSSKNLIDPNTAEKVGLLELMQRCIIHQESGLKLLPVKQLAGGMVSLKSGRKVSIFHAIQEGLIDRQVTIRLLEAQLFAGGIIDPRTGHRLTVEDAVRHNLIDQDMACAILTRQLQTGGIIDTVTGNRMTMDEAVSNNLVAPKTALVILESLWSFMGLLWPESGEILPITDALEQGIVSTELAHKILSKRQQIEALFLPTITEIWSWKKATESGILDKDLANNLRSVCIPDVMPHIQLADSVEQGKLGVTPSMPPLSCQREKIVSHGEKLLFQLMTHSYINVQTGQRLLLLDQELLEMLASRNEYQTGLPDVSEIQHQRLDTSEELQELDNGNISQVSSAKCTRKPFVSQFPSQNKDYPNQQNCSEAKDKRTVLGIECSSAENLEQDLFVGEQKAITTNVGTLKVINEINLELQSPLLDTRKEEQTEMFSKENISGGPLLEECPEDSEGMPLVLDKDLLSAEKSEWQAPTKTSFPCQKEQVKTVRTEYIPNETGIPLIKSQNKKSQFLVETSLSLKSQFKSENDMNINSLEKELNETLLVRDSHKQSQKEQSVADGHMVVLEKTDTEDNGGEPPLLCSHPFELLEEAALSTLSAQLLDGGIVDEKTGQKLLLNEAIAQGHVSSLTAVKLMGKLNMFRGFFDSQTCESLTTEEVIDEGLMDEKLLHNVLMSDKAISGILDPRTNSLCSVKEAVASGLIDKEIATRILEGQVVTGGIVDLKRGKKLSVTLASNLGLVDIADQTELISLEKATKGRDAEKAVKERLIRLQMESTGLMDPDSKAPLTVLQSVDRGLLGREEAVSLLAKQILDGGIIHHMSGLRLSVGNAFKHGLIGEDVARHLKKVENLNCHQFFHPQTKEPLSFSEAIKLGLVSPELKREIQEIQDCSGNLGDLIYGQKLSLAEANKGGSLVNKTELPSGMIHGVVDPENCRTIPYSELLKKCRIDIESGWRYLEVIPFSDIKDEVSDEVLTLSEAIQHGKVDFASTLKVLEAQANTGGIIDTATGKRLTLLSALEQKLLDETMATSIAFHQMLSGGIIDIYNDQRVTLKDAVEKRLISPELATRIQADTLEKQDGTEVCELKGEFSRKASLVEGSKTIRESYDKEEHEQVLKVGSQCAQEKAKVRISKRGKAEKGRKISLKKMEGKSHAEEKASLDNKVSADIISPGGLGGEPSHQVLVAHPGSEASDLKLQEVVRKHMRKCADVEQEKVMTQIKMISHVKQSASGLDTEEARECQGEMISKGHESHYEATGKLLSEQPVNVQVSKREKRDMVVKESIQKGKAEVVSKEKLEQDVTIGDECIKSLSMRMIGNDKGKETNREMNSSVCKTEGFPSQMACKDASLRNPDCLTCFSEGEMKTVTLCSILKPGEKLHQEIASAAQREPFSSEIPRPERLNYQGSDREAQVSDRFHISKRDMAAQRTSRHETTDGQDLCATSQLEETKDKISPCRDNKEKLYQEMPLDSMRAHKRKATISTVDTEEVGYSGSKSLCEDSNGDHELCGHQKSKITTTQETVFLEVVNPIIRDPEEGSSENRVRRKGPGVLVSLFPEKLPKGILQKESIDQHDAVISPTVSEVSEEMSVTLSYSTIKLDEKIPQEKYKENLGEEQASSMAVSGVKGREGVNPAPCRATQNVFTRRLCLEHDEKLVSYLSLLRDIEMRTKQIQPLGLNMAELQDLLCQAKVLDRELKDLSTVVSQELECVDQIVTSQPEEVPAQLLKALEKDAKNLQKSLDSVSVSWSSRHLHLQSAVEVKQTTVLTQHKELEGKLQDLRAWVDRTSLTLNIKGCDSETDVDNLSHSLQQYENMKQSMAERKSQLDVLASDIQLFISEHAQELSLQQKQQMLQSLNELQRSFQDLVEQTAAQMDALQGHLQQIQQEVQVKVRLNQQLSSICPWGRLLGVFWPASNCHDSRNPGLPTSKFHVLQASVV